MKSIAWSALVCLFVSSAAARGAVVLDQVHEPSLQASVSGAGNVGAANTVAWGQTFTVGFNGKLSAVEVLINRQAVVTQPLLFDIRTIDGDVPSISDAGANILTGGSIPASSIPAASSDDLDFAELGWVQLDLPDLPVTPGQVLALVLRSDDPGGEAGLTYYWALANDPGYPDGQLASRSLSDPWSPSAGIGADMGFRTYVDVVPEPSAMSLLACAALAGSRRRKGLAS